jgi:hypothetical protein
MEKEEEAQESRQWGSARRGWLGVGAGRVEHASPVPNDEEKDRGRGTSANASSNGKLRSEEEAEEEEVQESPGPPARAAADAGEQGKFRTRALNHKAACRRWLPADKQAKEEEEGKVLLIQNEKEE